MRLRCDLIRSLSRNSLSRILLTTATSSCPHLSPSSLRRWTLLLCMSWLTDLHDSENQEGEGAVQAEWPPECPGPVWQWPGQWAGPGGARRPGGQQQGPHALQHQPRQHQDVALTQLRVHGWRGEPRLLQGRCHNSPLTMSTLTPHVSTGPEAQISEEGASQDSQAEQPPEAGAAWPVPASAAEDSRGLQTRH